jgi:hypothetical protein
MSTLRGLKPEARTVVSENFRTGAQETIDFGPFLVEEKDLGLKWSIDLLPLRNVIEEAMKRFRPNSTESDRWLGPRVHAALRLTRREAADKRLWSYLTVVEFPGYVRWRWQEPDNHEDVVPVDRFLGEDSRNAVARLWWAAELTRNGKDYGPTVKALANSRFAVSWQHLDALHHRPAALAVVEFLDQFGGEGATDPQGQAMAKAFNLALRTLVLDALCDNAATDAQALREWCCMPIDLTKWMGEQLPDGPDEAPVPAEAIAAVRAILNRLAASIDLATVRSIRRSRMRQQE